MAIKILKKNKSIFSPCFFRKENLFNFPPDIKVQDPYKTLKDILEIMNKKQRGAYLRFGDGDINLLEGKAEALQTADKKLQKEMREAFSLRGETILKSLPIHSDKFGYSPGMIPGMHKADNLWAENLLRKVFPYFVEEKIYSPIALHYLAVFNQGLALKFLRTLKSFNPIFVGNELVPENIILKLFGSTKHIKTPVQNSFKKIDEIEQGVLLELKRRDKNYEIIVLAMGCAGRVLIKRLLASQKNIFIFDFGSLIDALCKWHTRAWIDLANVNRNYWEEFLNKINE